LEPNPQKKVVKAQLPAITSIQIVPSLLKSQSHIHICEAQVNTGERWLFNLAAFVVVLAGIKSASPIIITLLVALFVALISAPLSIGLQRRGIPNVLSVLIVLILLLSVIAGLSAVIGGSVNAFSKAAPMYEARLNEQLESLWMLAASYNVPIDANQLRQSFDTSGVFTLLSNLLTALGALLTNSFLILLIVVFILMEAASMPQKVRVAFGRGEHEPFVAFTQFMKHLNQYLAIKTLIGVVTGVAVTMFLLAEGVDFPFVLGLLAFLLNYIPTLGSILAGVPAVILAFLEFGLGSAGVTALVYIGVNVSLGQIIEPRLQGQGLGLSPMVVFLSLVFWGWLLGIVGILLAIPLTMTAKLAFEESPKYRWLAVLLGPERPSRTQSD
jgi:AI-2 transport protein TqsA